MNLPTLVLLTDFGDRDGFVGVMKCVLLRHLSQAVPIVDLCHHVPPQNVTHGAWVLQSALPYLLPKTVLMGVVDPGVGSGTQASLLVYWPEREQIFLAPDNGLLTPILNASDTLKIYHIQNSDFYRQTAAQRSQTFHGRDVYAPVAAMAANAFLKGTLEAFLSGFGPAVQSAHRLESPPPRREQQDGGLRLQGHVLHIDGFGNVMTDIPNAWLPVGAEGRLAVGTHTLSVRMVNAYQEGLEGAVMVVPSSGNTAELAVKNGSASAILQANVGQELCLLLNPAF